MNAQVFKVKSLEEVTEVVDDAGMLDGTAICLRLDGDFRYLGSPVHHALFGLFLRRGVRRDRLLRKNEFPTKSGNGIWVMPGAGIPLPKSEP